MILVGRERELSTLRRLYDTRTFQMPVLYGRRRVGKTYLMSAFTRDLPCIFFTAVEDSPSINLRNLSREIYAFEHPDADTANAPVFSTFQAAFEAVFELATRSRLVFVIDEYPYLAKADTSVSSILQALIDRNKEASKLYLMLCGSSLSFMREQVLGEKSPLYGRRTAQIELKPLTFFDARSFFPDAVTEDAVAYYGIAGGIPLYLRQFDPGLTVMENVQQAFLDPNVFLYEEPLNLLKQEVSKAGAYNAVIGAIAEGKTTNNEIATTVGMAASELTYYLKELQRLGLVERLVPIVNPGRRAVYRLRDHLFAFWYRFVLPYRSTIERGMPRRAMRAIEGHLPEYLGPVFERVCAEWLWRQNVDGTLPVEFDELGSWWGNNPQKRCEEEIDIVALDGAHVALAAECKWRNEPLGAEVDETLRERMGIIRAGVGAHRYLFSKSGFTQACLTRAEEDSRLHLIPLDRL